MFRMRVLRRIYRNKIRCFSTEQVDDLNVPHVPVMAKEVIEWLKPNANQTILDMTFGAGGHSKKILETAPNVKIITLDRDPVAYDFAKALAEQHPGQVTPLLGRFSELPTLFRENNIYQNSIDGVLFDFGCSSVQFDTAVRGFSLSKNGVLDMRMDGDRYPEMPTAYDVLSNADEDDLYKIIKVYGEEKYARKIARAIVETRYSFRKLQTTLELADLVTSVCGNEIRLDKLQRRAHAATKTFQALRIFVNNELNEINYGMILSQLYLKMGGRLVALSFHSLEDTIVKRHLYGTMTENVTNLPLKYMSHSFCHNKEVIQGLLDSSWKPLHKNVVTPSYEEVDSNPRSRSAKLRAAVKIK